jgi:predicted nuclease with TOPRIM domain
MDLLPILEASIGRVEEFTDQLQDIEDKCASTEDLTKKLSDEAAELEERIPEFQAFCVNVRRTQKRSTTSSTASRGRRTVAGKLGGRQHLCPRTAL